MAVRHFILGTAGHIDHGKSSLVKALTGTDPDRLPEERARGMTIDLGFAHLTFSDPEREGVAYDLGVIDVPGHADFVKNMVAGVGSIDVALIAVAADDGWMPQTEEHLQILTYLGVKRAVIALTKADLVEDVEFAVELVRENLAGTPFADAAIVPAAVVKGQGLTELKAALSAALRDAPDPEDIGKPRLPVDRVFSPHGIGTVVTGTLTGGVLARGQEAVLQPSGHKTNLRSLQSHSSEVATARPGTRTAINLTDLAVADKSHKGGAGRGDVVTLPGIGAAVDTLDVRLEKTAREVPGQPLAHRPVRNGQRVIWHHGGANHHARLYLLGTKELAAGESCHAELRFREPVFAFDGDRFVLRDLSRQATIAGGGILDAAASRPRFRKARQLAYLDARAAAPDDVRVALLALLARDHALPRTGLYSASRFSRAAVEEGIAALLREGKVAADGQWLLDSAWWSRQVAACGELVKAWHRANPQLNGMDLAEFSSRAGAMLPDARMVDLLLASMVAIGYVRSGKILRWGAHRPSLPPQLQQAGAKIRAALAKNLLEPPGPAEMAPTPIDKQALKFLIDTGEAVQIDPKAVLSTEGLEKLIHLIVEHLRTAGRATASDLRQVTGTTRRILIPLLERLDRQGITRRDGDFRTLPPPKA